MTIAAVTGANQGLGLALVAGLRARLGSEDVVFLTGRDPDRVAGAAQGLADQGLPVETHQLDVTDAASVDRFAATVDERGGLDILFSNAAARIGRDRPEAAQVRGFVATNNRGTTRLLRLLVPRMRPGGRLFVVASSFGTLRSLPDARLHVRFDAPDLTLDDIDAAMAGYVDAVEAGRAEAEGWPDWINIPSKVGQVAAVRVVARDLAAAGTDVFAAAVCPGLVDTDASRPWFDDMSEAQSPDAAAAHLVRLALDPVDDAWRGELVQFGRVLPWR
jgi:carbonyl reductase 1